MAAPRADRLALRATPRAATVPTDGARTALAACVVALVVAGVVLGAALDATWRPRAGARNPDFRRGVPWWVLDAPPQAPGESVVVLLGNSQAYGREVPEDAIYASRLAHLLRARGGRPVRVLNWSIPGGSAPEMVLQAAAAHRVGADAVVAMVSPGNFAASLWGDARAPRRLDTLASDARHLLAWPDVVARLPPAFVAHYVHVNDRLDAALARAVPLWRYRDVPRSVLLAAAPVLTHFEKDAGQERWVWDATRVERRIDTWTPQPVSPDLVAAFLATLADLPGRRIVIRMPAHTALRTQHPEFPEHVRAAAARGVEVLDLSDAVPDAAFLTASHLDGEGHARVAARLADVLAPR